MTHAGQQVPPPVKSRKRARKIVTTFHKLTREVNEVTSSSSLDKGAQMKRLQRQLQEMGGTHAYQSASLLSVSFHNTSKWVTQQLTKLNLRPSKGQAPLKVLEVRALALNLNAGHGTWRVLRSSPLLSRRFVSSRVNMPAWCWGCVVTRGCRSVPSTPVCVTCHG